MKNSARTAHGPRPRRIRAFERGSHDPWNEDRPGSDCETGVAKTGVLRVSTPPFDRSVSPLGPSLRIPPIGEKGLEGEAEVEVKLRHSSATRAGRDRG